MKCLACGSNNPDDATYCDDCGAHLSTDTANLSKAAKEGLPPLEKETLLKDRYLIKEVFSKGSFNDYLALDTKENDKEIAITEKIPSEETKFIKENKDFLIKIDLPALVKVFDCFEIENRFYLVTERMEGEILNDLLKKEKFPADTKETLRLGIELSKALSVLGQNELIYKDLQPNNILYTITQDAKLINLENLLPFKEIPTASFLVMEGYSPPEYYGLRSFKTDHRANVFSLGAVLYHMLTGYRPPLEQRETYFKFPAFSTFTTNIPIFVENTIKKAVETRPENRYSNMLAFQEALEEALLLLEKPVEKEKKETPELDGNFHKLGAFTDIGQIRSINQDSMGYTVIRTFELSQPNTWEIYIVADGMGGTTKGEIASLLAVRVTISTLVDALTIPQMIRSNTTELKPRGLPIQDVLNLAITRANNLIFEYAQQEPTRKGMGSTITVALINEDKLYIGQVGDTRAYYINEDKVQQLTEDHSLVGRLVKLGQISEEEAMNHPQRNLIYRALGTSPQIEVDTYVYPLKKNGYLLLCCDGLWEYTTGETLQKYIMQNKDNLQLVCKNLVDFANGKGGDDNISVLIIKT